MREALMEARWQLTFCWRELLVKTMLQISSVEQGDYEMPMSLVINHKGSQDELFPDALIILRFYMEIFKVFQIQRVSQRGWQS
ncbi:PREDICTED: uncharacterized protein LOC105140053 [Populus euphratica]|uniref:Uncharacterized protein LOC105140053 n=1 Tax=Populus euphratica TaxID=75702 RepID=A0AAJ6Y769_POPEU|nr:PREDICTED: uncharacterized protein LOC105140053 [Populus euphratica]